MTLVKKEYLVIGGVALAAFVLAAIVANYVPVVGPVVRKALNGFAPQQKAA